MIFSEFEKSRHPKLNILENVVEILYFFSILNLYCKSAFQSDQWPSFIKVLFGPRRVYVFYCIACFFLPLESHEQITILQVIPGAYLIEIII